ncbi:hypothetical protein HDF16_003026 [Granulicella aggregans]|uniref:Uncharacterized protein n=1 Tax=Granulicella aggregans TaxID=474949 RepID=A0A7W7ZEI5_9BACT|nr:hypothetical protein [Granulicella aggregans]
MECENSSCDPCAVVFRLRDLFEIADDDTNYLWLFGPCVICLGEANQAKDFKLMHPEILDS